MALIKISEVSKAFTNSENKTLQVLDNINFSIHKNEIIAILGKSGSGKSTLLRIIAGLVRPTTGQVTYNDQIIKAPVPGIAMVFQSFALLPWLTVLENVELGLEALGIEKKIRRQRALNAIDTIGLDGFESAYPKELSGGMKQRVGFARALVVEPEVLLMDEPFSALDILTSEHLRNDLLDLWQERRTHTKSILCVTHNIEEAILMADRILIFSSNPGRIQAEICIDLPLPRDPNQVEVRDLVDKIYHEMTISERERLAKSKSSSLKVYHTATATIYETTPSAAGYRAAEQQVQAQAKLPDYAYRIPPVDLSELIGLLESMQGQIKNLTEIDLPALADELHLDIDNLFPLTEVLDLLRFAKIDQGMIKLTTAGQSFIEADILMRKQIFSKHLLNYVPLAKYICDILDRSLNHRLNEDIIINELESYFSAEEADRIFKTIISWGRYAEIFAYDYDSGVLSLENPE